MKTFFIPIILFLSVTCITAQSINAIGSWSVSVPSNTISEAGNDYNMNLTSMTNQTILNVSPTSANWVVRVEKTFGSWHNSLELYAIRTGDGFVSSTTATVLGGTAFFCARSNPTDA